MLGVARAWVLSVLVSPEAKPVPIGCSPLVLTSTQAWALIFFRRHKPHAG